MTTYISANYIGKFIVARLYSGQTVKGKVAAICSDSIVVNRSKIKLDEIKHITESGDEKRTIAIV